MEEQLEFIEHNQDNLNELSLRMALKIADLKQISQKWRALAESTCMKRV